MHLLDLPILDLPPSMELLVGLVVVLLIGAIAGTAGFAATVVRRQFRLITELTERLAAGADPAEIAAGKPLRDRRLRESFERLAQRTAQTWTLATQDQLTEVANRQTLLSRLDEEIERATRYGRQLSIAMIDIDHFKRLNDTYGHSAGDLVLHRIAQVIQESVRRVDVFGRPPPPFMPISGAGTCRSGAMSRSSRHGSRHLRRPASRSAAIL